MLIGFIKKQRLNWLGHVERMTEDDNVKKIKRWKPCLKDTTYTFVRREYSVFPCMFHCTNCQYLYFTYLQPKQ